MGMNPPNGSQDDLVIKSQFQSNAESAAKAGKEDASAYAKAAQEELSKGSGQGQSNAPGMPGGAQAPGRGSASQSIYGAESKWRTSGQLPNAPASQGLSAADIAASGRSVPAEEMSPETARQRRQFLAETQRVSGQLQRRQLGETTQQFQDRQKAAARAEKDLATRESQFQRRSELIEGASVRYADEAETQEARGAGRAAKQEQRRMDAENADIASARQDLLQGYAALTPAELAEGKTVQRFQTQADRRAKAREATYQREVREYRKIQARLDKEDAKKQQIQDRQISAEEQGISVPDIMEGDRGVAAGRFPSDLAASGSGVSGIPTSRFGYASYRAQQAMKGGFGPGTRALTYGMSAVGQAILLGAPLINSFQGGAFGNLPLVGPYAQGDLQAQQALYEQQNQERTRAAAITYQRGTYGIGVQQAALGVARGREQQQYGFAQFDEARTARREDADYARSTAQLQRQATVDQRSYARSSADLENKRAIDERNYSRQIEDTQHSRMKLEQDFQRHYEDFAKQRTDVEIQSSRRREDIIRSLVDSTVTYTRGLQDVARQRAVVQTDYARQQQDLSRQTETATIGYGRQTQDLAISSGRANEDYARDRSRAQQQVADTAHIRQLESQTLLRDQRNTVADLGMEQFQSIGSLVGAAQSGDPFSIIGSLYRMQQLAREKKIVQGNISRGGFTEVQRAQQGIENRQQGQTLTDLDTKHAREQQDIALAQSRNAEDYKRQLDEIAIQRKRSAEDEKRNLSDLDIQEKRLGEDRQRSLDALGVQWNRVAQDESRSLAELEKQEKRFYQDYVDNLNQINKAAFRGWQDYAEGLRQIGISQKRLVEDRITQIQGEIRAQSALDVAHARALEDMTTAQQRLDIGHAQALDDFAKQETALYVARAQAEEDFKHTMEANAREREQNEIAANKEMRSMWEQLAISLGLAGIFSAQIVGSVKYLATFLATIVGGGGVAAAVAAAAGTVGAGGAAAGDISIGASQMGTGAAAAASTVSTAVDGAAGGIAAALAGIGLSPAAIQSVTDIIKQADPNFAGFGFGTPVAQAAEIQQGAPGGYSPMANSQGVVQGSQQSAYGSAGVPPNPMNTHTGGEPGGYSGLGADQYGTVNAPISAAYSDTSGSVQKIKDDFKGVSDITAKVKDDYSNVGSTSDDILKRFTDSYGYAQSIKDSMDQSSTAAASIKSTLNDAGTTFAQAMVRANEAASAGGSGGSGSGSGTSSVSAMQRMGSNTADPHATMSNPLGSGSGTSVGGNVIGRPDPYNYSDPEHGVTVRPASEKMQRAAQDASDIARRISTDQTTLEERQFLAFHSSAHNGTELEVTYADWLAINRPPNPASTATTTQSTAPANTMPSTPRAKPVPFGFRSRYMSRQFGGAVHAGSSYLVGETGPEIFHPSASGTIASNSSGGGADLSGKHFSDLKASVDALTAAIRGGGTQSVAQSALGNHVAQTMSNWLSNGRMG